MTRILSSSRHELQLYPARPPKGFGWIVLAAFGVFFGLVWMASRDHAPDTYARTASPLALNHEADL